jgi:hypothetical protein
LFDIVDKKIWLTSLVLVAIVGFVISLLLRGAVGQLSLSSVGPYASSVSAAITAATLWHLALSKWIWRSRRLRPWYVKCPDLTGRYRAELESGTYKDKFDEAATIRQTVEEISYESLSPNGNINKSLASRIVVEGGRLRCFIVYEGTNSRSKDHGMNHQGTIALTALLEPDGSAPKRISGFYYTNKPRSKERVDDRGTFGEITLVRLDQGEAV